MLLSSTHVRQAATKFVYMWNRPIVPFDVTKLLVRNMLTDQLQYTKASLRRIRVSSQP
jgi:hypothetical protein